MFIFFFGKENEPKETARATGFSCASHHRRVLWNPLRSDSHRPFSADGCDARARDKGDKTLLRQITLSDCRCVLTELFIEDNG